MNLSETMILITDKMYEMALELQDKPFLLTKMQEAALLIKEIVASLREPDGIPSKCPEHNCWYDDIQPCPYCREEEWK